MYGVLLLGKQCRINNSESESESVGPMLSNAFATFLMCGQLSARRAIIWGFEQIRDCLRTLLMPVDPMSALSANLEQFNYLYDWHRPCLINEAIL